MLGGVVIALTGFLGGASGFGQALTAAPLLLLLGFPLGFVVTANLAITAVTRLSQTVRFRGDVSARRAGLLVVGSIPGLYLGVLVLTGVDESAIKLVAGVVVMVASALMLRSAPAPASGSSRGVTFLSGFGGGFLASTTSLNGVAAVLLLARERLAPVSFMADLSFYYVVSSVLGLALLAFTGALSLPALFPAVAVWLPGSLAGNYLGASLGSRLPERLFRRLTLGLAFLAGALTAVSA